MKNLDLLPLFDLYGEMLSDMQRDIFDLYYNEDLSLAEIAENIGISRQGVRDNIKRSEEILKNLENKLCFLKKTNEISKVIDKAVSLIESGDTDCAVTELKGVKL